MTDGGTNEAQCPIFYFLFWVLFTGVPLGNVLPLDSWGSWYRAFKMYQLFKYEEIKRGTKYFKDLCLKKKKILCTYLPDRERVGVVRQQALGTGPGALRVTDYTLRSW